MEAVPRLPMLAFELKHSPEYVDFGPTLKKFIRDHYGEDPAVYNKNFADLDQLRQNAIHVTRDFVGCATLKRYYAQLHLMNGRFPMGEAGEAAITFTWEDNQTGRDHVIADIKFEQACILYNIGALHSNLGAIDTRQNAEGMKVSCTHFQCAAWAFEHLRDHFGSSAMSTDLAHEYLTFHVNLMLAQAQECILEKSMIDSRKNTITAKVAAQVVEFYRQSVKNLNQCNQEQIINSRSYKDWKKRIELKIAFYQCITHYYMGRQTEEQQQWGERLSYFQAAQDKLNESVKLAKNEVPEMQEALTFAQDVVGGKLQSAQKDNDFVYHEKIPPIESLPEVKGAPLVKGIPFDPTDPEICGPDLFQKLVPMEAHEASSVYSEEKAKVLRAVTEDIGTANTELEQFMESLQIDPSMFEQAPDRLPQDLLEKCAAMSVRTNAIKDLVGSMSVLSGLATEAEMNIKETQAMIAEDSEKSEEFEKQFGKKMTSVVLPNMVQDCEEHLKKHEEGSQLNASLHAAMNAHIANLKMLALPPDQLQAQLPPAHPPKSPEDEEVMTEMRRLLSKVDEMKKQRGTLENQFREAIHKDDITTVLMGLDSNRDNVYKDQLKKHDSLINVIGQNLIAQSNILRALTDANARFAALRQGFTQQVSQREAKIKDLFISFEKYEELLAKSTKGQDYYRRLNESVLKTLERCRSECKVRQEERDLIMSKYMPKAPPSRPTAPKPGHGSQAGTPSTPDPAFTVGPQPLMDPSQFGALPPAVADSASLPNFEGPKLKDFLPFMKPQSFGPKRSSPSRLPPGSPDPMLSGPPSFASSASDSPQHPTLAQLPPNMTLAQLPPNMTLDQLPPVGPHGVMGYHPGAPGTAPDVAASDHLPSVRHGRASSHQPRPTPPPDVTANLPVNPGLQPQYSSLPDVSSLPSSRDGSYPQPYQVSGQPPMGGFGGAIPAVMRGSAGPQGSGLTSSTESLASTGSYQQGFVPGAQQGLNQAPLPAGFSAAQNMSSGQHNVPQHPSVQQYRQSPQPNPAVPSQPGQYRQSPQPNPAVPSQPGQYRQSPQPNPAVPSQPGQYRQSPQPNPAVPSQPGQYRQSPQPNPAVPSQPGQYPMPHGTHGQQNMVRPSPAASPSAGLSPASSPAPSATSVSGQQGGYVQAGYSMPSHPASVTSAAVKPGTPQQTQPHPFQHQQQQPFQHQQQQAYQSQQQPQQQQYYAGGTQPQQTTQQAQQGQQYQQVQQPQNPGVQPQARMQGPVGGQMGQLPTQVSQQTPQSVQGYGQQGQTPFARPSGPTSLPQQSYTQMPSGATSAVPGSSFGQQPYGVSSAAVQPQYSAAAVSSGHGPAGTNQSQTQSVSRQPYTATTSTYSPSSGQIQTQQVPGGQLQTQQVPGGQLQTQQVPGGQLQTQQVPGGQLQQIPGGAPQQQFPQPHSQAPAPSQPSHLPSQQPFQQQQGQMNQNQTSFQGQGQYSGQVQGQGQRSVHGSYTASQAGYYPSPAASPAPSQAAIPAVPNQQQSQSQQAFPTQQQQYQPQGPQQQQRFPATGGQYPGYSQSQPGFSDQQFPPGQAPQPGQVQPRQGQTVNQRAFPGQQGYPTGTQQQQPTPQQQFSQQGQQQYPQQQQAPQKLQQFSQQQNQLPQNQQLPQQQQQQLYQQQRQLPQQQQQFPQQQYQNQPQQYPQQQQAGQQQYSQQQYPQSQMQGQQQMLPQNQPQPVAGQQQGPPSQPQYSQPPQQQQQFTQYPTPQQPQPRVPPAESQLIFPTPLQPSRAQSVDNLQPQPTTSQQAGGVAAPSQPQAPSGPHSLPPQNPDPRQSTSSPAMARNQSSLPASLPPQGTTINQPPSSQRGLITGPSLTRQQSSLDELLSSSPEGSKHTPIPAPIITPMVLTEQEKQQQKEDAMKKGAIVEAVKDPYQNSSVLNKFVSDVEAFGKFVDDLSITILGVSRLDTVWKSLIDSQDHDVKKQSIAIARCYPMKNRDPDIMPYDDTRVVLTTTKDDYINASWINDLAPSCPKFVATQAPLNVTMTDFWAMVYELGSEVIVQITSEYETGKKFPLYFPTEKGQQMEQGPIILNLQSVKYRQLWTERNVYLKHSQTKQGRTVIHLQFKTWPVSGFPDEALHILRFISEVHSFYQQQRSLLKPVIVHCGNGVGRTGAFLMIYTGMQELLHGNGLIDVPALAKRMLQKRKNIIHKKEQLKFCYDALLCFAEEFLKKRNILVQHPHFEKKTKISAHTPSTSSSDDIVLGSVNLHTLQQTVGRLHVHEDGTHPHYDQQGHILLQQGKEGEPVSALPDLIQQQTRSDAGIGQGGTSGGGPGMSSSFIAQGSNSMGDVRAEFAKTHSRSGSNASQQSMASLAESGSSRASPQHGPASFSHSPSPSASGTAGVAQTLADLQDPSKFTIGKGELKKRITKSSFDRKGSGAGMETKADPADPLSSLDPMWTVHKPGQTKH